MRPTRQKTALLLTGLALVLGAAGCGGDDDDDKDSNAATSAANAPPPTTTPEPQEPAEPKGDLATKPKVAKPTGKPSPKLVKKDLIVGKGRAVKSGEFISVNYVGVNHSNGEEFDTSFEREPFQFQLGAGMVIPGWDQGIVGMKVGGRRELRIPPKLAYGEMGQPPDIPGSETLIFVVDLLSIG